ncbi:MAG: hypothetical protein WBW33_23790 [Bryobacteraceae bacterium]
MRWPAAWRHPSALALVQNTGINYLLMDNQAEFMSVVNLAKQRGLQVATAPPAGFSLVKGEWPGIALTRSGKEGEADAGPTGEPWVDSNGWRIALESASHPGTRVWVDAAPPEAGVPVNAYLIAMADAEAYQGRWVLTLAAGFAADVAKRKHEAMKAWKQLMSASAFFAERKPWAGYAPRAVVGVISDFSGENQSSGQELLNMLARANQQYKVILKEDLTASLNGLRAIVYVDAGTPAPELRARMLGFVEAGGLLVTRADWHPLAEDTIWKTDEHPRFSIGGLGKGRVAVAKQDPDDPYLLANDSVTLVSRRYDLLRFWNFGPVGSLFSCAEDQRKASAQIVSFAEPGVYGPTVWVAGAYRNAKLWTLGKSGASEVKTEIHDGGLEVQLPPVSIYAAVELET